MSRSPVAPRRLVTRTVALAAAGLVATGAAGTSPVTAGPAATWDDQPVAVGTPVPGSRSTPSVGSPSPARPSATQPAPCPAGQTPTPVTRSASPTRTGSGTKPRPTPTVPATTLPDGRVVTQECVIAPPTPMPGPSIAADHVVGGARLGASGIVVDANPGVPPPPDVTDVSYLVADLDTGAVLVAKSPHALLLPASTIKTLLAVAALPILHLDDHVVASPADQAADGSRVGLLAGNDYTVDELFLGLILVSGNDTAYAISEALGGRAATLTMMNAAAGRLGAWDTLVKDPSGLDEPGQRSSAYDLALFGRAAMRLPEFRRYAITRSAPFPGGVDGSGATRPGFEIQNHNLLLANYPGTIGVKNGYTTGARHTFIGAAERGGRRLLVTQLGGVVVPSWEPTAALLDWSFRYADRLRPVGTLVEPGTTPLPPEWAGYPGPGDSGASTGGTSPTSTSTPSASPPSTPAPAGAVPAGAASVTTAASANPQPVGGSTAALAPSDAGDSPWPPWWPLATGVTAVALAVGGSVAARHRRRGRYQ